LTAHARTDFADTAWQDAAPGLRVQRRVPAGKVLLLVEFSHGTIMAPGERILLILTEDI
jgi:hypothetical protein